MCRYAADRGHVEAVFIQYGQPSIKEEHDASQRFCRDAGIWLHVRNVDVLGLEDMHAPAGQRGPRIVPVRNLLFLSVAANLAASIGCQEVWLGATAEDKMNYPDCRSQFIHNADAALSAYGLKARAPLLNRTRADMIDYAKSSGWNMTGAWSCYRPVSPGMPCMACDSCLQPVSRSDLAC